MILYVAVASLALVKAIMAIFVCKDGMWNLAGEADAASDRVHRRPSAGVVQAAALREEHAAAKGGSGRVPAEEEGGEGGQAAQGRGGCRRGHEQQPALQAHPAALASRGAAHRKPDAVLLPADQRLLGPVLREALPPPEPQLGRPVRRAAQLLRRTGSRALRRRSAVGLVTTRVRVVRYRESGRRLGPTRADRGYKFFSIS